MSEYVYFAQAEDGRIKIGYTTSPARRMQTLTSQAKQGIALLRLIYGTRLTESDYHAAFASDREVGEWFWPSTALLKCIEGLADAHLECPPAPARPGVAIAFRISTDVLDALRSLAHENDRSLSAEIRRALKKHVVAEAKAA